MQIHTYISAPYASRSSESESSINSQTHYIENNWPDFKNIIAMSDED